MLRDLELRLCLVEPVQNSSLEGVQALADNRRRRLLLPKVPGEALTVLLSLVDQSLVQCWVLCGVDTVILVVLSAGAQKISVGRHVQHLQAFQCCAPMKLPRWRDPISKLNLTFFDIVGCDKILGCSGKYPWLGPSCWSRSNCARISAKYPAVDP